jgi:hypothetical protein
LDLRSLLRPIRACTSIGRPRPCASADPARDEAYPLARVNEVRERLEAGKVRYPAVLQYGA